VFCREHRAPLFVICPPREGEFLLYRKGSRGRRGNTLRHNQLLGKNETSIVKREIQDVLREIVTKRDGDCIFSNLFFKRDILGAPICGGYAKDGHLILQADHLITRANATTYAEPRLVVCVCKGHHGWKKWHERERIQWGCADALITRAREALGCLRAR
jgi:hypothetical protein